MDIIDMIISPIIGGIIGWFTNWLAIKMLFRPYTQKRLFGVKVPFTPGLIPKERQELARKIGLTTTEHVLTDEVLTDYLATDEINEKVGQALLEMFANIESSEKTIGDIVKLLEMEEYNIIEFLDTHIISFLEKKAYDDKFIEVITNHITNYIIKVVKEPEDFIDMQKIYLSVKDYVNDKAYLLLRSNDFDENIRTYITKLYENFKNSEKTLSDIAPEKLIIGTKKIIADKVGDVGEFLEKFIEKNPEIDEKLRGFVHTVAKENFGRLVGIFINYDKIYDNIKENTFTYLSETENQELIVNKIFEMFDKALNSDLNSILDHIPQGIESDIADKVIAFFKESEGQEKIVNSFFEFFNDKFIENINLYETITKIEPEFEDKLNKFIYKLIEEKAIPATINIVSTKLPEYSQKLLNTNIKDIINKIPDKNKITLKEYLAKAFKFAVQKGGSYMLKNINFEGIIEDKINDFEVKEIEEIIVSVVNKELNAITWLGGVLGFVIGVIPVITGLIRG